MPKATRAALLSGLLFPGAGQFHLRKRLAGTGFVLAAGAGLLGYLYDMVIRGFALVERALPGFAGGGADLATAQRLADELAAQGASPIGLAGLILLLLAWVGSVAHALLTGRQNAS